MFFTPPSSPSAATRPLEPLPQDRLEELESELEAARKASAAQEVAVRAARYVAKAVRTELRAKEGEIALVRAESGQLADSAERARSDAMAARTEIARLQEDIAVFKASQAELAAVRPAAVEADAKAREEKNYAPGVGRDKEIEDLKKQLRAVQVGTAALREELETAQACRQADGAAARRELESVRCELGEAQISIVRSGASLASIVAESELKDDLIRELKLRFETGVGVEPSGSMQQSVEKSTSGTLFRTLSGERFGRRIAWICGGN